MTRMQCTSSFRALVNVRRFAGANNGLTPIIGTHSVLGASINEIIFSRGRVLDPITWITRPKPAHRNAVGTWTRQFATGNSISLLAFSLPRRHYSWARIGVYS